MLEYHIYEQREPIRAGKDKKGAAVFEMDIVLIDTVTANNSDVAIEIAKRRGIKYPIVECVNGYDAEGRERKESRYV